MKTNVIDPVSSTTGGENADPNGRDYINCLRSRNHLRYGESLISNVARSFEFSIDDCLFFIRSECRVQSSGVTAQMTNIQTRLAAYESGAAATCRYVGIGSWAKVSPKTSKKRSGCARRPLELEQTMLSWLRIDGKPVAYAGRAVIWQLEKWPKIATTIQPPTPETGSRKSSTPAATDPIPKQDTLSGISRSISGCDWEQGGDGKDRLGVGQQLKSDPTLIIDPLIDHELCLDNPSVLYV